jgi:hypothetical protein
VAALGSGVPNAASGRADLDEGGEVFGGDDADRLAVALDDGDPFSLVERRQRVEGVGAGVDRPGATDSMIPA